MIKPVRYGESEYPNRLKTMTDNDEDSEMIDVAIIGAAEIGNAGCNASASAQFNTTELPKAIQAAQSEDGQPNESFTTPSDVEGGQDHNTDDDDDWDSIYASADGHLSSANVPRYSRLSHQSLHSKMGCMYPMDR